MHVFQGRTKISGGKVFKDWKANYINAFYNLRGKARAS